MLATHHSFNHSLISRVVGIVSITGTFFGMHWWYDVHLAKYDLSSVSSVHPFWYLNYYDFGDLFHWWYYHFTMLHEMHQTFSMGIYLCDSPKSHDYYPLCCRLLQKPSKSNPQNDPQQLNQCLLCPLLWLYSAICNIIAVSSISALSSFNSRSHLQ